MINFAVTCKGLKADSSLSFIPIPIGIAITCEKLVAEGIQADRDVVLSIGFLAVV